MNYYKILGEVGEKFFYFALIYGSYYACKITVLGDRESTKHPASILEKIKMYLSCIVTALILAGIIAAPTYDEGSKISDEDFYPTFLKIFIVLIIPSICGVYSAFKKDSKMSEEERFKIRKENEKGRNSF